MIAKASSFQRIKYRLLIDNDIRDPVLTPDFSLYHIDCHIKLYGQLARYNHKRNVHYAEGHEELLRENWDSLLGL